MFRVGQKVVCVDASRCYRKIETDLVKGAIYEIEAVETFGGDFGLVVTGARSWWPSGAYNAVRFRPIVEHKTDISIFTKMLTPKTRRVQERA